MSGDQLDRSAVDDCRITEVEPIVLTAPPGTTPRDPWLRGWGETFLVRIRSACGAEGCGVAETQPEVARAIVEASPQRSFGDGAMATLGGLRELLVGRSAAAPVPLWQDLYDGTAVYGRRGAVLQAISAVDMACVDLLARYLGLDAATLLGGRFRNAVPAYASAVLPDDPGDARRLGEHAGGRGFGAVKVGWGAFREENADVLALVEQVRAALPASTRLIFDIGYERRRGTSETVRLIRALEAFDPIWIEEPCHPDDLSGYREVARRVGVPIAAGEACATAGEFASLIAAGVEVLQPDLSRCGGFTVAREVAALAAMHNRRVVPHCWQNDLLTAATAAFCVTLAGTTYLEYSLAEGPLREICTPRLELEDGCLAVPARPGFGVTPDPAVLERLAPRPAAP